MKDKSIQYWKIQVSRGVCRSLATKAFKDFAANYPNSPLKDITLIAWGDGFDTYSPELLKQAQP